MEKELIKTDNYLLVVDDSEIKEGDLILTFYGKIVKALHIHTTKFTGVGTALNDCKKIIAHLSLNDSPVLEGVPLLPPLEDYVEELSFEAMIDYKPFEEIEGYKDFARYGFVKGYNKAKEKYKFTEDDVMKAIIHGAKKGAMSLGIVSNVTDEEFIQSLSQPKMPTHFEFETLTVWVRNTDRSLPTKDDLDYEITSTTNAQGQEVACGKYTY